MADRFRPDYASAFKRQYSKLSESNKKLADDEMRAVVELVNLDDPNSEAAKKTARELRIKVIQRFKRQRPRRMEATFSSDGRIVWALDKPLIRFIYIGNHSVLDKN
ncbi:MAG: hypothetical protein EPN48_16725 [Microbacteriaceae bacterium]|nr:MAG: hypothetical protein EPN48_16725 [Microbacteriaceae bacterium]